ncbi:OmpP1/FadL family transporter [Desulfopila aestuarii]|uniref:Long-chain fatty acid transport protein n=1 Tax=Desulfopila aestuarii DSM 18488 TaxID=1121416 RepID=A0A1M7YLV8_9BACT|nr:outer membrane protein transport protein [Desulfopila aestuarii]SHO53589.1 long-chain fatty acid transport protein [Desulfopila aestuarii DSM 18488]
MLSVEDFIFSGRSCQDRPDAYTRNARGDYKVGCRINGSLLVLPCLFIPGISMSAGLWLYELGTPDLGTAGAGRAAIATDASTAGSNPAGMTRLDRSQMLVAIEGIYVNSRFDLDSSSYGGGDGGNAGGFVPAGSMYYVHSLSEDLKLGVSFGSNFGLGVDYGDSWAGRYFTTEAEFVTVGLNPSVGYKVNNWMSVGAGVDILYAQLTQKVAIQNAFDPDGDGQLKLEDDDVAYGYNLGILFEPRTDTRFGITYRSKLDVEFKDVASLSNIGPVLRALLNGTGLSGSTVDLKMTVPQAVMLSGYHQLNRQWAIMGNIGWQDWSAFGKQDLTLASADSQTFTKNLDYDDTWHAALGAQYRFAQQWLWSVGVAYDTSPVKDDDNRTPDLPLDRQIRVGTGIQYDWNEEITSYAQKWCLREN